MNIGSLCLPDFSGWFLKVSFGGDQVSCLFGDGFAEGGSKRDDEGSLNGRL